MANPPTYTNAVSITPTGNGLPPSLASGPTSGSITTKKATITWSTSRTADSKVQFGTSSGSYNTEEPSNSDQVTSHSINLTGLSPGTTYYYKSKWTDEDGNTGTSDESSFTTASAPAVSAVSAINESLTSAAIQFTVSNAAKATIQYGKSTSYGGTESISTSTSETTYTVPLTGLEDGTIYHYRIVMEDSESDEYYSDDYSDLETLPRPRITNVRLQEVKGTAQPTVLVSWSTNTEVSSIITYYPNGDVGSAKDEINTKLAKGEHKMLAKGLFPDTTYSLIVKGRDIVGNEATSDIQTFTTQTDTRPPLISDLKIEGSIQGAGTDAVAQLLVSFNTDEPATSQVEYGEGTGSSYSQKTQEDATLTYNHLVVISGLTPSKVYHLRVVSNDSTKNTSQSVDTVSITPKATESALDLVIGNLKEVFSFLK